MQLQAATQKVLSGNKALSVTCDAAYTRWTVVVPPDCSSCIGCMRRRYQAV